MSDKARIFQPQVKIVFFSLDMFRTAGMIWICIANVNESPLTQRNYKPSENISKVRGSDSTVPVDPIPELGSSEPLGGVAVETDDVLAGGLRGEGELSLTAVHLRAESKTINPFSNVVIKHNPQNFTKINIYRTHKQNLKYGTSWVRASPCFFW